MSVTYGNLPGVRATVTAGSLSRISVGYEQKLVMFGRGDAAEGNAEPNTYERVRNGVDAADKFGNDTQLAHGLEKALSNGANNSFLYGVMAEEIAVSGEPIAGGSGTLANSPIVEDPSTMTITNTTTSTEMTPVYRYESVPETASLDPDQVAINPTTGEFDSGDTDAYEVDYAYLDWDAALDAADPVVNHQEIGVYAPLSDSATVAESLAAKMDELRPTYKLVRGVIGAQPNATSAAGEPIIDVDTYTDNVDNEAVYMLGPVRLSGVGEDADSYGGVYGGTYGGDTGPYGWTILGGIAGVFAGNDITNAVVTDKVRYYGSLVQELTSAEMGTELEPDGSGGTGLRGKQVIPIRDDALDGEDGVTIEDNISTSTARDYSRTYHYMRVIDQGLLSGKEIGESLNGRILTQEDAVLSDTEETIIDVFRDMASKGLIEANQSNGSGSTSTGTGSGTSAASGEDEEQPYSANIVKTGTNTYELNVSFKPAGVAKNVIENFTIDESAGPGTASV